MGFMIPAASTPLPLPCGRVQVDIPRLCSLRDPPLRTLRIQRICVTLESMFLTICSEMERIIHREKERKKVLTLFFGAGIGHTTTKESRSSTSFVSMTSWNEIL